MGRLVQIDHLARLAMIIPGLAVQYQVTILTAPPTDTRPILRRVASCIVTEGLAPKTPLWWKSPGADYTWSIWPGPQLGRGDLLFTLDGPYCGLDVTYCPTFSCCRGIVWPFSRTSDKAYKWSLVFGGEGGGLGFFGICFRQIFVPEVLGLKLTEISVKTGIFAETRCGCGWPPGVADVFGVRGCCELLVHGGL